MRTVTRIRAPILNIFSRIVDPRFQVESDRILPDDIFARNREGLYLCHKPNVTTGLLTLYERALLGRARRLCSDVIKSHFERYFRRQKNKISLDSAPGGPVKRLVLGGISKAPLRGKGALHLRSERLRLRANTFIRRRRGGRGTGQCHDRFAGEDETGGGRFVQ